jgi:N6-adenosine-specific RNA methylase IME4
LSYTKNQPEAVKANIAQTKKDTAKEIADKYNLSDRTIRRYGELAEEFDKLAETKPELFQQVKSGEKTLSEIQKEVKQEQIQKQKQEYSKKIEELAATSPEEKPYKIDIYTTNTKFRVVYADPPWSYNDKCIGGGVQSGGVELRHYNTMTITEISNLPVANIIEKDAVLFMWVTSPLLAECWPIISAWGFEYKTSFVWDKVKHNMGHYNSVRHELLLICGKGKSTPDTQKLYDSVQSIEKSDIHSEKPIEFMNIIDDLYTYGNRIELFARDTKKPGWYYWGNEV